MDSLEQQKSGQDAKVSAGADDLHRIIGELHRRASHHRWVGVITVASAAIVILAGLIPVVALIQNPFINIPKTADLSVLITNSSVRLFALAIIGYMVHLLTSIYRYNTQLLESLFDEGLGAGVGRRRHDSVNLSGLRTFSFHGYVWSGWAFAERRLNID